MLIAAALEQVVQDNYAAAQASERQVDRGRAGQVIRDGDTRTVARASATYLDLAEQSFEAATIRLCTDTYRRQPSYQGKT
jgi:hypothetical protein